MSEKEIKDTYDKIQSLLINKRLKEALLVSETFVSQCQNYELTLKLENCNTSYNLMLQYMEGNATDPNRKCLYQKLITDVWSIIDQAHVLLMEKTSSNFFYITRRNAEYNSSNKFCLNDVIKNLEDFKDDLLLSKDVSEKEEDNVLKTHEDTLSQMFTRTWINTCWSPDDKGAAEDIVQLSIRSAITNSDACLLVSAVTLSLMECFDERKIYFLGNAYGKDNIMIGQRALVGLIIVFHLYRDRLNLYSKFDEMIEDLADSTYFQRDLLNVYKQILLCQDTEKIDKKIRDEIMPEVIKNMPNFTNNKLGIEESDEESNDKNPDWEDKIKKSGIGDKIKMLNDLQMEGADVNMTSFASMKHFPFFLRIENWFYPFDKRHSNYIHNLKSTKSDRKIIDFLFKSGMFCDSDQYSLISTIDSIPTQQRDLLFSQISENMDILNDSDNPSANISYTKDAATVSNLYLQDLYRFFKLNIHKNEFHDFFKDKLDLENIPLFRNTLHRESDLRSVADFMIKREHWNRVLELFEEINVKEIPEENRADFYQKYGYVLQKFNMPKEAIRQFLTADSYKPDNVWTNHHLATCYRKTKSYNNALIYYHKVEATNPEDLKVIFYIGTCLVELKKYKEALNYFFKLNYLDCKSVKAMRGIGWCSFMCKKYQQATNYYDKVISEKPLPVDFINKGHVAWVTKDIANATQNYRTAATMIKDRDKFLEVFLKDKDTLIKKGIKEDDIYLMLDMTM
ncbi:MAG: tetratricopeptide repeat protein [Bacteroidaceae bacterium]